MNKKQKNIFVYFLYMIIVFLLVDFANQIIPSTIGKIILYSKYGTYILVEALAIVVVFIVMMLAHNYYVFIQKRENFLKSIGVGGFMLGVSLVILLPSLGSVFANKSNAISLIVYCITIGIFEEFLCRGWLLNEFIERFGNNRKNVLLSIILSSLIFGGMHITNIWLGGQTVFETLIQILQATALGFIIGGIYYRTKNIWAVAFLHGFWDFAILSSEVANIRNCMSLTPSKSVMLYSSLVSLVLVALYICIGLFILRTSKISPLIEGDTFTEEDANKEEKRKIFFAIMPIFLCLGVILFPKPKDINDYTICFKYNEKSLGDINFHTSSYQRSAINEEKYNYAIKRDEDKNLVLINNNTKEAIVLFEYKNNLTYKVDIEKNNNFYSIAIFEDGERNDGTTLYYSNYIKLDNMSNDKEYLKEVKDSLKKFDLPKIKGIGYITKKDEDFKYIYGVTARSEYIFVDENSDIFMLTTDTKKQE